MPAQLGRVAFDAGASFFPRYRQIQPAFSGTCSLSCASGVTWNIFRLLGMPTGPRRKRPSLETGQPFFQTALPRSKAGTKDPQPNSQVHAWHEALDDFSPRNSPLTQPNDVHARSPDSSLASLSEFQLFRLAESTSYRRRVIHGRWAHSGCHSMLGVSNDTSSIEITRAGVYDVPLEMSLTVGARAVVGASSDGSERAAKNVMFRTLPANDVALSESSSSWCSW